MKITILINCKDQKGIISKVTDFIHKNDGNITYLDQYVERDKKKFFMRLECDFKEKDFNLNVFKNSFKEILANPLSFTYQIFDNNLKKRMAIFVSKYDHCLYDILSRFKSGELSIEIPVIISNHPDLETIAKLFEIPFFHIPHTKNISQTAQNKHIELLNKFEIDFVVLARYMQIMGEKTTMLFKNNMINIHHSFLPAFAGAKPYHSAFSRGVKVIGATSHYVIDELDAGPIIEQSTKRVSHLNSIEDLISKGRDLEKIVLSRAIKMHVENKVLVSENKTIIFS
ncbi:MAG: formyltetrahydrofolate deformylase [Flavobacteriaceae bacterium]